SKTVLLFERTVVFFVDDDEPERGERHEDRAAGTDQYLCGTVAASLPHVDAFALAERGVIRRGITKSLATSHERLRRQRDHGNENERLLAALERRLDRLEIDLGLAAAGHAVDQKTLEAAERGARRLDRETLFGGRREGR